MYRAFYRPGVVVYAGARVNTLCSGAVLSPPRLYRFYHRLFLLGSALLQAAYHYQIFSNNGAFDSRLSHMVTYQTSGMKFDKIKKVKIHAEVEKNIRRFITANNLIKGDKLPSERQLTERLGIGRSSLREALRSLEALGVLEILPGKGIYVGNNERSSSVHEHFLQLVGGKVNVLELLQVRRQLELLAVELASVNATKEQLDDMESSLIKMENKGIAGIDAGESDLKFHKALYEASGNSLMPQLADIIYRMWTDYLGRLYGDLLHTEGAIFVRTTKLHRPLFEAIRDKDSKGAQKALNKMLDLTARIVAESEQGKEKI